MTEDEAVEHGANFAAAHIRLITEAYGTEAAIAVCGGMCLGAAASMAAIVDVPAAVEMMDACARDTREIKIVSESNLN